MVPNALRRRAATLLAALAAVALAAAPAGAAPPPSAPANLLTCGQTSATDATTTSATPAVVATCTIDAPVSGTVIAFASAGTALVDTPFQAVAAVRVRGSEGHARWVDVGADEVRREVSVLGVLHVPAGAIPIDLVVARSGSQTGTARLTRPRVAALFVPDASRVRVCAHAPGGFSAVGGELHVAATCTASATGPSRAIVFGSAGVAMPDGGGSGRAHIAVRIDGGDVAGSDRSADVYADAGDGTDTPIATVATAAVADGSHTFELVDRHTGGTGSVLFTPAIVALVVPDDGSRLVLCSRLDDIAQAVPPGATADPGCFLTAPGTGTLLTTASGLVEPAATTTAEAAASLQDGVERPVVAPSGRIVPWQDAAVRDVAAGLVAPSYRVRNPRAPGSGTYLFSSGTLVGLYVPTPDTTAPNTGFAQGPASLVASRGATFAFTTTATDDADGFLCSLDGGAFAPCSIVQTFTVGDGAHTLEVSAKDDIGNIDQTPAIWQWTVDASPPVVTITSPTEGQGIVLGSEVHAAFTCTDPRLQTCTGDVANGALLDTGTAGARTFVVTATDTLGNGVQTTVHYKVGRPITVTAGDASIGWLAPLPTVGATAQGLLPGDTLVSLGTDLVCAPVVPTRRPLPPGTYPTRCSGGANAGYLIGYADGTLTVAPPPRGAPPTIAPRLLVISGTPPRLGPTCSVGRLGLATCTATLVATIGGRPTTLATGTVAFPNDAILSFGVAMQADARLRRLAGRPGGLAATLRVSATQVGYAAPLTSSTRVIVRSAPTLTLQTDRLFRGRTSRLTRRGATRLATLAGIVAGWRTLTCTGHTDARGPARANLALGRARARAVCAALRGPRMTTTVASRGESRPRATNRTAAGRALNRRVVLAVGF